MADRTLLEQLACFVYGIRYENIPEDVRSKVCLCITDALECCLSPMKDNRVDAAFSVATASGLHEAALFGFNASSSVPDAAFFNTVKGSVTNRNDIHPGSAVHAGAVIVPVVLAIAEEKDIDGRTIVESVLCGYEISARLGKACLGTLKKAWRTTPVFASAGAAAAAAKAMGLTEEGIMNAMSLVCNTASGFNEWASAGTGEDAFQNAFAARNGIICARLAAAGAEGCASVLEGPAGYFSALGVRPDVAALIGGLGSEWMILNVIHKPIECCIVVQAPCQCANNLVSEVEQDIIEKIDIFLDKRLLDHPGCANKDIRTMIQAVMSVSYGVSVSLLCKDVRDINWMPPFGEPVLDLVQQCRLHELNSDVPALAAPVRVEITTDDGKVVSHEQTLEPLSDVQVRERFLHTAEKHYGLEKASAFTEMLLDIGSMKSIRTFIRMLD